MLLLTANAIPFPKQSQVSNEASAAALSDGKYSEYVVVIILFLEFEMRPNTPMIIK